MGTGVQVWSQTAATNATVDTNVNWAEGMAPSAVNDSARAEMSSVAKWRDDNSSSLITSGSSTAFTLATNQVSTGLSSGYTVAFQFHATADTSATLNVDAQGAKPLQVWAGNNLSGGEYQANSRGKFTYTSSGTGQWISHSPPNHTYLTSTSTVSVTFTTGTGVTDGPTINNTPTVGTWFVTGQVTVSSSNVAGFTTYRLWDGTNIFSSSQYQFPSANIGGQVCLCGFITNPVGNIRLSAQTTSSGASYTMTVLGSGLGKDFLVSALRIA